MQLRVALEWLPKPYLLVKSTCGFSLGFCLPIYRMALYIVGRGSWVLLCCVTFFADGPTGPALVPSLQGHPGSNTPSPGPECILRVSKAFLEAGQVSHKWYGAFDHWGCCSCLSSDPQADGSLLAARQAVQAGPIQAGREHPRLGSPAACPASPLWGMEPIQAPAPRTP